MATIEQLSTALINADKAGDTEGARALAAELRKLRQPAAPTYDPTEGMSTFDKLAAGAGKAIVDTGRGLGQMVGLVNRKDVEESRKLDAPLMNTTAGKVGNFAGNMALVLPTVAIPGAATVRGAATIGALQGLIQPSTSTSETVNNALLGGSAGAGGVMAGRAVAGLYQGGKALVEPFTQAGREKIAGRMIQRFAQDPTRVATATSTPTVTGALPTLAEQTGDAGLARLQDSLRASDPQIGNQIGQRLADNNAARVSALQSLAGDSTQRAAAETARATATKPLYEQAFAKEIEITPELRKLLSRPSVQQALGRALNIAKEEGRKFDLASAISGHSHGAPAGPAPINILDESGGILSSIKPDAAVKTVSGQTLQDLKMGLDALLKDQTSGIAGKEAINVKATRDAIVQAMESAIPEFRAARTGYAAGSKPLNAMDIGEEIARRATSNTSDLAGNPRMQANALLGMLRDEPALIQRATGRKGLGNKLADIMTPEQMNKLQSVANEADRAAAVATAGNGPGSATAQRMASQNILRQLIGPTGMPASWAESALANTVIGKPFNLVYGGVAEPKIQQALAEAVLNPQMAQRMLQAGQGSPLLPRNALTELLLQSGRSAPSTLATTRDR